MFRSKKLEAIVEAIDTMWDLQADANGRVLELEKRIAKLERQLKMQIQINDQLVKAIKVTGKGFEVIAKSPKKEPVQVEVKRGRGRPRKNA